jgi:hypothetical protein
VRQQRGRVAGATSLGRTGRQARQGCPVDLPKMINGYWARCPCVSDQLILIILLIILTMPLLCHPFAGLSLGNSVDLAGQDALYSCITIRKSS